MKRTYHLCWSGGNEVLFRTREDYIHGIICLCIACHEADVQLAAYCFMSNHVHLCVRGSNIKAFIKGFRYSYTRYFNAKYRRRGKLGERYFFRQEIYGIMHLLTTIAYILRNPVHHGICSTPFEYEFSSVSAAFRKELGVLLRTAESKGRIPFHQIPSRHKLPAHVKISENGGILPESIIDVEDIEHQFSTARTYLYFMNRLSGEEWEKEQEKDSNGIPPIKIEDIERGIKGTSIRQMLVNENGRNYGRTINDMKLCEIIDSAIAKNYKDQSVYTLPEDKVEKLTVWLQNKYHVSSTQINRCLGRAHR